MRNPFKRKPATHPPPTQAATVAIRDTLFGDMPLEAWPPDSSASGEPWTTFVAARDALSQDRRADAVAAWQRIAAMPGLESRHVAQAWHFLRAHGVACPADQAKRLLGVILEVPMEGGLDLLAAYPEHTARYYNFSGRGIVWEHPDASLDPAIDALLAAGQNVLNTIGPWDRPRPPAPTGEWRMSFFSPAGLHFGQAPYAVLADDPMAKPVIDTATALMQALVARTSK